MIKKSEILFEIFLFMKRSTEPKSQKQIIDYLVEKGHKKTTIASLFAPCILQPIFFEESSEYSEPMIRKVQLLTEVRSIFKLNEQWDELTEYDAKKLFNNFN